MVEFILTYTLSLFQHAIFHVSYPVNHALIVALTSISWILNRCSRSGTDLEKVSAFLLDHPRRCFLYLFPPHQTWFLLLIVLALT